MSDGLKVQSAKAGVVVCIAYRHADDNVRIYAATVIRKDSVPVACIRLDEFLTAIGAKPHAQR